MTKEFSIYESPLSEETMKLRRNTILSSVVCLFVSFSGALPTKISAIGLTFDKVEQQATLGWFIFFISLYLFLHFISNAFVEVARWLQPYIQSRLYKTELLKHPAFDPTTFINQTNMGYDPQEQDLNVISTCEYSDAGYATKKKLKPLYVFIYLKLFMEVILPLIIGLIGLFKLYMLITSY
ncbi:hypothetical protein I6F48_04250 [Pseudoalteromonas sp. SWYJ118]|uniref:hypothetical protein n=1 Tax=Pseudoalteromonas sp. SWYJ118 TaxID=2792062 RepID=UPI0018CF2D26|nr:hypothetical protein [Pseudoalteromonas sp. SWYJ118]MBH0074777.1 hypothetical protein [Pseudoalteromonas sp. SWYJ118]